MALYGPMEGGPDCWTCHLPRPARSKHCPICCRCPARLHPFSLPRRLSPSLSSPPLSPAISLLPSLPSLSLPPSLSHSPAASLPPSLSIYLPAPPLSTPLHHPFCPPPRLATSSLQCLALNPHRSPAHYCCCVGIPLFSFPGPSLVKSEGRSQSFNRCMADVVPKTVCGEVMHKRTSSSK